MAWRCVCKPLTNTHTGRARTWKSGQHEWYIFIILSRTRYNCSDDSNCERLRPALTALLLLRTEFYRAPARTALRCTGGYSMLADALCALVTYGAGRIPSNKIENFSKTDPMAHGLVAAQRRRSPRSRCWGGVTANTYRTPERKALTFNSPGAPERANPRFSGGSNGGGARRRGRDRLRAWNPAVPQRLADGEAQTDTPVAQRPSWSWSSAISAFTIFLLSLAGGMLGGLVGNKARGHHAVGVCAGRAMANRGKAEGVPMRAVVDGGCTHVCFNDPAAFRPGSMQEPDKPTYMLLGDNSRVPVKGVGTVELGSVLLQPGRHIPGHILVTCSARGSTLRSGMEAIALLAGLLLVHNFFTVQKSEHRDGDTKRTIYNVIGSVALYAEGYLGWSVRTVPYLTQRLFESQIPRRRVRLPMG